MPDALGASLVAAGHGLVVYRDYDSTNRKAIPVQQLISLGGGPRGVHGVCQGPDGDLYLAYGNDDPTYFNKVTKGIYLAESRGGAILRSSLKSVDAFGNGEPTLEVLAYGFDNPYDLDFHASGRLFTADVDKAADYALPSYRSAALYDVAWLRDHGRTLSDDGNAFDRPKCFYDAVAPAADLGRAAPSGLAVYRHRQFPQRYRGGMFAACWKSGRIDFVPLQPEGASSAGVKETFLELTGNAGLTPIDLAVGPAGDLFVAYGGHGTPGAVWRIRYDAQTSLQDFRQADRTARLRAVLQADQPLAAWSRERWIPIARTLGKEAFVAAIADATLPVAEQVRAVEILVELFEPITLEEARAAVALKRPELSARIAWLIDPKRLGSWSDLLCELTFDPDAQRSARGLGKDLQH
ncbi:MAG: hypothetical protein QM775_12620 [Pirellulales bacterium]